MKWQIHKEKGTREESTCPVLMRTLGTLPYVTNLPHLGEFQQEHSLAPPCLYLLPYLCQMETPELSSWATPGPLP